MTTSAHRSGPKLSARAIQVQVTAEELQLNLEDGRSLRVPLAWFPRLAAASPEQRDHWKLVGRGVGIHWPGRGRGHLGREPARRGRRVADVRERIRGGRAAHRAAMADLRNDNVQPGSRTRACSNARRAAISAACTVNRRRCAWARRNPGSTRRSPSAAHVRSSSNQGRARHHPRTPSFPSPWSH